jgi:hypothetical protein
VNPDDLSREQKAYGCELAASCRCVSRARREWAESLLRGDDPGDAPTAATSIPPGVLRILAGLDSW